jgi:hypothetical protein
VVADADVVEHAAKATQGDAHAVGAAEAAELAASFDVRFEVEEDGRVALLKRCLKVCHWLASGNCGSRKPFFLRLQVPFLQEVARPEIVASIDYRNAMLPRLVRCLPNFGAKG